MHKDLQAPVAEGRARACQAPSRFRAADADAAEKHAAGGSRGGGKRGTANGLADGGGEGVAALLEREMEARALKRPRDEQVKRVENERRAAEQADRETEDAEKEAQKRRDREARDAERAEQQSLVDRLKCLQELLRAEKQDSQKRKLQELLDAALERQRLARDKAAEREAKETDRLYAELERLMPPSDLAGTTATAAGFLKLVRSSALVAIKDCGPKFAPHLAFVHAGPESARPQLLTYMGAWRDAYASAWENAARAESSQRRVIFAGSLHRSEIDLIDVALVAATAAGQDTTLQTLGPPLHCLTPHVRARWVELNIIAPAPAGSG